MVAPRGQSVAAAILAIACFDEGLDGERVGLDGATQLTDALFDATGGKSGFRVVIPALFNRLHETHHSLSEGERGSWEVGERREEEKERGGRE